MLKDSNFSKTSYYLPSLVLIIFFITEFISKILKFNDAPFNRISGVVKLVLEILILLYIYKRKRKNFAILLKIGVCFLIIYSIGHIFILPQPALDKFIVNLYSLNGYLFVFILFYALHAQNSFQEIILHKQLKHLDKAFKLIFIVNSVAIILGLLFSIDFFQTYPQTNRRFGYNGMFLHASHSSYIYILYILYFYNSYLKIKIKENSFFLIFSILISFIIATKTIFFFNILFLLYLLYKKISLRVFLIFTVAIAVIVFFVKSFIFSLFKSKFNILYEVYINQGFTTMIFSTRNQSISKNLIPYMRDNWSFTNFMFGGSDFSIARTEIEIFDLFWFFGLLGALAYIYIIYKTFIKTIIKNSELRIPLLFLSFCIILAGSFFTNAPVIPYFIVFFFSLKYTSFKKVI